MTDQIITAGCDVQQDGISVTVEAAQWGITLHVMSSASGRRWFEWRRPDGTALSYRESRLYLRLLSGGPAPRFTLRRRLAMALRVLATGESF